MADARICVTISAAWGSQGAFALCAILAMLLPRTAVSEEELIESLSGENHGPFGGRISIGLNRPWFYGLKPGSG